MRKMIIPILMAACCTGFAFAAEPTPLDANCSSFSWSTKDGKHLLGRTYDMFGNLDANKISVIGEGYELSLSPDGSRTVETEYGFLGMTVVGTTASPVFVDGVNEKGLMGCLLNFPDYGYFNTNKAEGNLDIYPGSLLGYLLGTCATVDEAAKAMERINLTDEPVYGKVMSVHYILSDSTGETIIIEPDEDGIRVHRSTIGVMANSPNYEWQKTNLKNYVAISNLHTEPRMIAGEQFSAFGDGTGGMFGLPGGYSSPSRFVRIAFMKNYAPKGVDEIDGITRMFHSFAVVDIPEGLLKESPYHENYEQTLCTSVMCSESATYYFSPYTDRRITALRVTEALKALDGASIGYYEIPKNQDINYLV